MKESDLPIAVRRELESIARYSEEFMSFDLDEILWKHVPIFRRWSFPGATPEKLAEIKAERKRIRAACLAYYEQVSRLLGYYPKNRCPSCGKKVNTRRCLACELEAGIAITAESATCAS